MVSRSSSIQVIGGGVFGLSSAYHLAKNGYKVTVIDREVVPSPYSAGYDLNKIIRPEYEDQFYTILALEAIELWETEFSDYFHKVGYVNCNSDKAPKKSFETIKLFSNALLQNPKYPDDSLVFLKTKEDFKKYLPHLNVDFEGWDGYYNKHAGYAHALKAMTYVKDQCVNLGVEFVVDRVESLVYTSQDVCLGALGVSGEIYKADLTIVAAGAHATKIVPELGQYVTSQAWSVGHLQLSAQEAAILKGMPVFNCRDIGFCFEPDEDNNVLKMCNSSAGWVNMENGNHSVPTESNDGVCKVDNEGLKKQVSVFFPEHVEKTIIDKKICWCCDRANSDFVIDYHPKYKNLLFATADSGHAFKMLPIFGKWVVQKLEKSLDSEKAERWKWFTDDDLKGDEIDQVTWRLGDVMNLRDEERV